MNFQGKKIHIVGICGIGMSAIAQHLNNLGAVVQGSDKATSGHIQETLHNQNIKVFEHSQSNISSEVEYVIRSTAIQNDNVEILQANALQIPILSRSDILTEITKKHDCVISITGAHGKTTTTTMTGELFYELESNPTIFSGGIMGFCNSNFRGGSTDLMIVEADESDGTFMQIKTDIAVITNIEFEHAEFYKDFNHMIRSCETFVNNENVKNIVLCGDDHGTKQLQIDYDKKVIRYGFNPDNDLYAKDLKYEKGYITFTIVANQKEIQGFKLRAYGNHNVLNALCAFTIALVKYGLDEKLVEISQKMMRNFGGIARRFNILPNSKNITIIDDYAHHPTEIRATIEAAKQMVEAGKLIAVLQPHRYTRLSALMDDFTKSLDDADVAIVTEVYAAGEQQINRVSSKILCDLISKRISTNSNINLKKCFFARDSNELFEILNKVAVCDNTVVFMGAGNITEFCKQYTVI